MERHYKLAVTSDTTNIDVNSVDAAEVARIVQLAGMSQSMPDTMPTATDNNALQRKTSDQQQLSDLTVLRKNAGMSPMPPAPSLLGSAHDDHPMDGIQKVDEDVAEYDFGHRTFKDEGEEIDEPDYIWQAVENPQRIKGSAGDNGLIQELHTRLTLQYQQYLTEEEAVERENDAGLMSPLSDPTKPSFDKDPLSDVEPVTDGSHSPMSTIVRQHAFK